MNFDSLITSNCMFSVVSLLQALCLGHPTQSAGTVIVMDIIFNRTVDLFADWPAYFGPDLDQSSGFKVRKKDVI